MNKFSPLVVARDLLNEVLVNNITFSNVLKSNSKKYALYKDVFSIASALVGCELRHHLIFQEITKRQFGQLSNINAQTIYIALANNLFIKKIDEKESLAFVINTFKEQNASFEESEIINFLERAKNTSSLIPDEYQKNSIDFLSLRFNTPKWLVKMWNKAFGEKITYKVLKSNTKIPLNTVRVNPYNENDKAQLLLTEIFEKSFVEDVLTYKGKAPIKRQKFFENNTIFPMKMAIKHIFDNLNLDSYKGIAVYQGHSNNTYLEAIFKTSIYADIDIILSGYQDYVEAKNYLNVFKTSRAHIYRSDAKSIITCVSRKVDTFIVTPKSSNFDLLRTAPDYFLRFQPDSLDSLINDQYSILNECADLVDDGGQIVYIVPTLSPKEGQLLVRKFIENHKEFSLENERQYFPFDPYDSSLYCAILRKEEKHD